MTIHIKLTNLTLESVIKLQDVLYSLGFQWPGGKPVCVPVGVNYYDVRDFGKHKYLCAEYFTNSKFKNVMYLSDHGSSELDHDDVICIKDTEVDNLKTLIEARKFNLI